MLYVAQMAHVTICRGLPNVKVLYMYLWIVVGLPTPLLIYYLVAPYVCWG